jgi:mRNA-degrading endonuclease toxin of MazEF toxin-antitoxin module
MNRWLGFGVAVGALVMGGVVLAGTPFGGDDTGTIPSDSPKGPVTKCENTVGKAVATLVKSIGKCTASRASGKLTDDTMEDACEQKALTKFGTTKTAGCGTCTNLTAVGAAVEMLLDSNNDKVYCTATGTPFGGDDTGNVPSDAPKGAITKCENGVNKAVGTLVGAISKCHALRASGKLTDDTMEDACEQKGLTKFGKTKITGCDSCTNLGTLGSFVETTTDGANALVYCASPSAAFLDVLG